MKEALGGNNRKANNKTEKRMSFAATFYPWLRILQRVINKNLNLLYMNEELKKAFTPKAMISDRSSHKISSFLVWAIFYQQKTWLLHMW